jgi:peptidoglycan/xylan/chitin deacetylase (PgdA/CDA1 family)
MSWAQLAALQRCGFEIGSHTHAHRLLTQLDPEAARFELMESRRVLERELGAAPEFLAYPGGRFNVEHQRMARSAGYGGACAVILGWRDLSDSQRFALRRMTIKGTESMAGFRLRLLLARWVRIAA